MATEELSSIRESVPLQQASKHSSAPPDFSVSLRHTYVSMEVYFTFPHHSIPNPKKWGKPKTKMSSWLEVHLLLYLLLSVLNRINIQWNYAYFSRVSDLIIKKSTDYATQIWRICRVRKRACIWSMIWITHCSTQRCHVTGDLWGGGLPEKAK